MTCSRDADQVPPVGVGGTGCPARLARLARLAGGKQVPKPQAFFGILLVVSTHLEVSIDFPSAQFHQTLPAFFQLTRFQKAETCTNVAVLAGGFFGGSTLLFKICANTEVTAESHILLVGSGTSGNKRAPKHPNPKLGSSSQHCTPDLPAASVQIRKDLSNPNCTYQAFHQWIVLQLESFTQQILKLKVARLVGS